MIPMSGSMRGSVRMSTNWPLPGLIEKLDILEREAEVLRVAWVESQQNYQQKQRQVDDLRSNIRALLRENGLLGDKTDKAVVTIAAGPPRLVIEDPELIPDEFFSVQPIRDDKRIKARLQSGVEVPGAKIVATDVLRVKWKAEK